MDNKNIQNKEFYYQNKVKFFINIIKEEFLMQNHLNKSLLFLKKKENNIQKVMSIIKKFKERKKKKMIFKKILSKSSNYNNYQQMIFQFKDGI